MSPDEIPEDKIALYQALVDVCPDMELLGAKKLRYTSVNGHMYSMMSKDGRLGMRLSKDDQKAFIQTFDTIAFKNYGANIRDYVEVPGHMLDKAELLASWLNKSLSYTLTLKPK